MLKILFVCHGNICRSTMAEFLLKDMVKKHGISEKFHIESAATSTEEIGAPVYPGTKKKLAEHGISCDGKTSRRVTAQDYHDFDLIICMDNNNLRNLKPLIGEDVDNKVKLMMSFCGSDSEVADPWYTRNFDITWDNIYESCEALLRSMNYIK